MNCAHCGRPLQHVVFVNGEGYGAKCARNLFGAKPEPIQVDRAKEPDPRQLEIWPSRMERLKAMLRRAWWTVFGRNDE